MKRGGDLYVVGNEVNHFPCVNKDSFSISFSLESVQSDVGVEIEQSIFKKVNQIEVLFSRDESLSRDIDTTHVMYIGEDEERWDNSLEIRKKLQGIARGGVRVERAFGVNIVDTLGIIDSNKLNAFVFKYEQRNTLFFYDELINLLEEQDLEMVARHETIHHLINSARLYRSEQLIEWYQELMKEESLLVVTVNEGVYYSSLGGHAHDNISEFLASYINSLFALENLPQAIDRVVRHATWNPFRRQKKRKDIINDYILTLEKLEEAYKSSVVIKTGKLSEDNFFTTKKEELKELLGESSI